MHYSGSLYRKTVHIMIVVCGLLFSIFSFVYLYVFQRELLEALHYSLAQGKTPFVPVASAAVVTVILLLLRWGVNVFAGLKGYVRALSYVPSFLALCALTDVGRDVYISSFHSCWTWLFPLLCTAFIGMAYLLRHVFPLWLSREGEPMGVVNWNLFIILALCVITVLIGNTDRTFHHELQAEHYLRNHEFDKALRVGEKSLEASRTLTALRAVAMANTGTMGERLFDYPQYYHAEGLFFSSDSLETLRYTNDSIYGLLGARPIEGESRMAFLRGLCENEETRKSISIDYYLSALLLDKNLDEFAAAVKKFYAAGKILPRFHQEAMVLYRSLHADSVTAVGDTSCVRRFMEYSTKKKEYASPKEQENWMRRYYGNTYWWYFDYQK